MTMPVFVKIDEYKEVLDVLNLINKKLEKTEDILNKITELKNEEDAELDLWHKELEEIEKKVEFMTKTLVEPAM